MSNILIQKLRNFLQTITLDKTEKFFFALFLLSIPHQTRLTFITPETYLNGTFNEYATFFLYLSDLLFITTLFLFFVKQAKKHRLLTKTNNFSVKEYIFSLFNTYPRLIPIWTLLVTLITWSFVNILWSEYKNLAFYQSFKTLEFALLFLYTYHRLRWFGFNKFTALIFVSGSLESIIGISQYLLQKSLGLKILMESVLSPETPNVAKIVVDGERIIRAYGTFPHPNVFSGFLLLSIFCGFWLLVSKLFHVKQFSTNSKIVSRLPNEASKITAQSSINTATQIVSRETISNNAKWSKVFLYVLLIIGLLTQLAALVFTFSRITWLASIIIFIIFTFLVIKKKLFLACPPKLSGAKQCIMQDNQDKLFHACPSKLPLILRWLTQITQKILFHVKQYLPKRSEVKQFTQDQEAVKQIVSRETICLTASMIISLLIIINFGWKQISSRTIDTENNYQQSTDNRILYNDIAINMIKKYPITGIGNKNFTLRMQDFTVKTLEWWQFQPTHNIYLLVASEMGLTGLTLFLALLYFIIRISLLNTIKLFHVKQFNGGTLNDLKLENNHTLINIHANTESDTYKTTTDAIGNEQIVSRVPFGATAVKAQNNASDRKEIVSRETILVDTQEGETILLQLGLISILIGFLFIGLFDHYFWTLQQGQLAFWLVLGAISAFSFKIK